MASEEETVYCLCRKPYDENEFMIECDVCKDWFHGSCVGVQEYQASDIEIYHCPNCQLTQGPLVLKKRRNWHRHDYSEQEDSCKAVQTGTVVFIKELKNRTFPSADEIPIARLHGSELNIEYFKKHGFNVPIVVEKKDGLGLVVPPAQFSIQDVENNVGSMREIDVIDVSKQEDYKMLMREWTEYYNSPNRHKVYNVISLEFSNTKMSELVFPPSIVRDLSWVSNYFPEQLPDDCTYTRPEVQKYCLMGVRDSFTDFHIDFGGTSVWYHILRGEKIFYLVRPTQANLSLYESWVSSSNQSETFFGDQVDVCYKCVIKQGQTLFIPTGWIHAVFTPIDSLVFGGNFLHDFNISLQLQVYDIERRIKTPSKYLFPSFETTHWYAAKHVLDVIKDYIEDCRRPPEYLLMGAKSLAMHLKSWTQRKDLNNSYLFLKDAKHDVPEHLNYGRLLKDLQKEIRAFDTSPKVSPVKLRTKGDRLKVEKVRGEKKKKKKNLPTKKQMMNIDLLHQHTTEALQAMDEERKSYSNTDEDSNSASLKVRIPKAGAYLDSMTKKEKFVKLDPDIKQEKDDLGIGLKLKVSKGKIISDAKGRSGHSSQSGENEENDSDTDNLVVDENPRKNKRPMGSPSSASTMKPGSLKLKLSFAGKALPPDNMLGHESTQESETATSQSEPEESPGIPRANLPTIQGGLNCSISDILEASGYGTETDFIVDNERTSSPSMRDAIQGMLSMSRMGDGQQLFRDKRSTTVQRLHNRNQMIMEEEAKLEQCYKDEEFIYPGLDLSDDEMEQVRDSKGSRDDNWNPKARVHVSGVKGERPHREGVKKEAVEQVLAAAAAKPAPPKPKKPRKRLKSESFSESDSSNTPGTALSSSAPGSAFRPNLVKPVTSQGEPSSPVKAKKPKKGLATAKQRLGKILKINKLGMF
ncbi:histone lysine demethylase PHF8-like isoform X1 [Saccostrea echinata]|uniref:histone lysine demethylase PHF8-like isoform X1 n=1 Tax=Saccostrea echinata TaxID=191078 RepID=UPI002A81E1FF|nr:histone lysine demethylase PHF8-like isoform X1 [Saccostrea echinata]